MCLCFFFLSFFGGYVGTPQRWFMQSNRIFMSKVISLCVQPPFRQPGNTEQLCYQCIKCLKYFLPLPENCQYPYSFASHHILWVWQMHVCKPTAPEQYFQIRDYVNQFSEQIKHFLRGEISPDSSSFGNQPSIEHLAWVLFLVLNQPHSCSHYLWSKVFIEAQWKKTFSLFCSWAFLQ